MKHNTNQKQEIMVAEASKEIELVIHEIEENSVIVNVDGWRVRLYFDENADKETYRLGGTIVGSYFGDIENIHSIKFNKLK